MLGFTLKKLFGLNIRLRCSTGILNVMEIVSGAMEELE
jgi:hypothetical protein